MRSAAGRLVRPLLTRLSRLQTPTVMFLLHSHIRGAARTPTTLGTGADRACRPHLLLHGIMGVPACHAALPANRLQWQVVAADRP